MPSRMVSAFRRGHLIRKQETPSAGAESSAHSIVQAADRINRHRLVTASKPNPAILQYNAQWAERKANDAVSIKPGVESADYPLTDSVPQRT